MKRYLFLLSLSPIIGCAADSAEPPSKRSFAADGTLVDGPSPDQPIEKHLLAELVLPNGNVVTFSEHLDGGLEVSEQGLPRRNAIGELAEFADASPYEMFVALAPEEALVPTPLVVDQTRVVAERTRTHSKGSMPPGFRVDALPDFYAQDLTRAFNACTDTTAWSQHVGESTIGDNCSAMAGLDVNWCDSNFVPDNAAQCDDDPLSCTTYMESGYRKTRASACGRNGVGTNQFAMGIKNHSSDNWSLWFDKDYFNGGYFYFWLSYDSTKKDFWRADIRDGSRNINRSWWVKP